MLDELNRLKEQTKDLGYEIVDEELFGLYDLFNELINILIENEKTKIGDGK
jgi:hypothetical protein